MPQPQHRSRKRVTARYAIGIDLGGTNIVFALTDLNAKILKKIKVPTLAAEGRDRVLGRLEEGISRLLGEAGAPRDAVKAIGLGSPGPLNVSKGMIVAPPNLPGFKNTPVRAILQARTGLPFRLENDANAAALGEYHAGAGRGCTEMLMLTLGTGVGGAIISRGELYGGVDDTAGEFGHMVIDPAGPLCGCGQRGCLEQFASATAIGRVARQAVQSGARSRLLAMAGGDVSRIDARLVHLAASGGDALAKRVWAEFTASLGLGVANLINIFNPQRVVLAGGVMRAGRDVLGPVRAEARRRAFKVPAMRAKIVAAKLGDDAGVIGAAVVAITREA